ncbi:MAG: hypothetical protein M0R17_02750 [Candidatus Omnitrophica bacterium]|jgi:hypothetical protein|nr:hypothetical protein [Candidatus Omnitrophota bacterium]
MSLSRKNKITRIEDKLKQIPNNLSFHTKCSNLKEKSDKDLSYLLQRLSLIIYKYSEKGKISEEKYRKSEVGKKSANKRQTIYKKSEKYDNYKQTTKKEHNKKYRDNNQEKIITYRKNNKDKWITYRVINKEKIKERNKTNWKNNDNYRIKSLLRHRLWLLVKKEYKKSSALKLLGISIENFKKYIISKFTEGMTWEKLMNGEIHIDHIVPCAVFNLKCSYHQKLCFHWSNLQPLWATTKVINNITYLGNINKGDFYEKETDTFYK